MGVSNSQKYTITKHAAKRIQTRFNISPTQVKGWMATFFSEATFFQYSSEEDNKSVQVFKKDDVLVVLNIEEYKVITAYPYNPFNKTNGLSENIVERLQPSLDKIVQDERRNLRDDLDGLMLDLQFEYQAFQNHPKSEADFKKYLKMINKISKRIEISQEVIADIRGLKK